MADSLLDQIIYELERLRVSVRLLTLVTAVLFAILTVSMGIAFYIRSTDLEDISRKANSAEIRSCFRGAALRQAYRDAVLDPRLTVPARDLFELALENSPTVSYCRELARQLHIPVPEENG